MDLMSHLHGLRTDARRKVDPAAAGMIGRLEGGEGGTIIRAWNYLYATISTVWIGLSLSLCSLESLMIYLIMLCRNHYLT